MDQQQAGHNKLREILDARSPHTYERLAWRVRQTFGDIDVSGKRVLEIGCGGCEVTAYLTLQGAEYVLAIDPCSDGANPDFPRRREQLREALPLDCMEFRPHALSELPGDSQFDIVLGISVIEHIHETEGPIWRDPVAVQAYREAFRQLHGLLAPGGYLLLTDHTRASLPRALEVVTRRRIRWPFTPTINWNIHQTLRTWKRLAREGGFRDFRVRWHVPFRFKPFGFLFGNRLVQFFTFAAYALEARKAGR